MSMLPIFASIIIFGVYSAINGQESLTSAKVYTVLSVFNLISTPMRLLVMVISSFVNAKASMDRVNHFFGYEEKNYEGINENDSELQIGDI
jgi:ABC-type multidrug transport system fused ATPase/permease subunit